MKQNIFDRLEIEVLNRKQFLNIKELLRSIFGRLDGKAHRYSASPFQTNFEQTLHNLFAFNIFKQLSIFSAKGVSRTSLTFWMVFCVALVKTNQPSTNITKSSALNVGGGAPVYTFEYCKYNKVTKISLQTTFSKVRQKFCSFMPN